MPMQGELYLHLALIVTIHDWQLKNDVLICHFHIS